jgi:hypothetical protein
MFGGCFLVNGGRRLAHAFHHFSSCFDFVLYTKFVELSDHLLAHSEVL